MPAPKVSRSALQRTMAAQKQRLAALRAPAEKLDDEREQFMATFVPKSIDRSKWESDARPFVVDLMRRSHVTGKATFPQLMSDVCIYVGWAMKQGLELDLHVLMDHDRIEQWSATEAENLSQSTTGNRRSRLRNLASHVLPGPAAPPRPAAISRAVVQPPYSLAEIAAIIRLVGNQPTKTKRRQLSLLVAAGLGAGASARDIRHLHRKDIRREGAGVWWLTLAHPPREVPLVAQYGDLLKVGIERTAPEKLLIGTRIDRKSAVSWIVDASAVSDDHPAISQARLRSTWMLELMCRPVPLAHVLRVTGLSSCRSLTDLLPYSADAAYVALVEGGVGDASGK